MCRIYGELGAREDRLNTLCTEEIWAGPPKTLLYHPHYLLGKMKEMKCIIHCVH